MTIIGNEICTAPGCSAPAIAHVLEYVGTDLVKAAYCEPHHDQAMARDFCPPALREAELVHLRMHSDTRALCGLDNAQSVTAYRGPQFATDNELCGDCLRHMAPGTARTIADAANARGEWAAPFLNAWQAAHRASVKA